MEKEEKITSCDKCRFYGSSFIPSSSKNRGGTTIPWCRYYQRDFPSSHNLMEKPDFCRLEKVVFTLKD